MKQNSDPLSQTTLDQSRSQSRWRLRALRIGALLALVCSGLGSASAQITKINFQRATDIVPQGYIVDSGDVYGDRGSGRSYGWNVEHATSMRKRSVNADQRLDTLCAMKLNAVWEMAVANGSYNVEYSVGDPLYGDGNYNLNVEGVVAVGPNLTLAANTFRSGTVTVNVADGKLTVTQPGSPNLGTRINYLHVSPVGTEVIVDNAHAVGFSTTGTWTTSSYIAGFYGTNYAYAAANSGATARFTPTLTGGNYEVSIRFAADSNRATSAPVDVIHANGTDALSVDMRTGGGTWVPLGTYRFNGGSAGSVLIATAGAGGFVIADAVRFVRTGGLSDAEILATGLTSWRKPDGDGISCADCHGPAGYDVAIMDLDNADLRRTTAPHLTDTDADNIFAMVELLRRQYPPAGGLKDVATFRPFQPGGQVLGGADKSNGETDSAFGVWMENNLLIGGSNITTLAQAQAARDQIVALDVLDAVPSGLKFNKWSHSISREGPAGGSIAEWVPGIGRLMGANKAAFHSLQDAYIANPSTANFWAMFHKYDEWSTPDPVNNAPTNTVLWGAMARMQLKGNVMFQHEELLKSIGAPSLMSAEPGHNPFSAQAGTKRELHWFWDVGDLARVLSTSTFSTSVLPLRHQNNITLDGTAEQFQRAIDPLRITWFYLGWALDNGLMFSGATGSTLSGEYFITSLWAEDYRFHQVFFNAVHNVKRGFVTAAWNPSEGQQHFEAPKGYWLAYGKYKRYYDDPGYPGSAARYKRVLANVCRMFMLLHEQDIKDRNKVINYNGIVSNPDTTYIKEALRWAQPEVSTVNEQIISSWENTIQTYPR